MGTRSAHAPPGGSLGRTRAGTAKGIGRELVGRAGQAAGAKSEPTWSPSNTPRPTRGYPHHHRTPGLSVQLQGEALSMPRPSLCHSPPARRPQKATQPVSWSVKWNLLQVPGHGTTPPDGALSRVLLATARQGGQAAAGGGVCPPGYFLQGSVF